MVHGSAATRDPILDLLKPQRSGVPQEVAACFDEQVAQLGTRLTGIRKINLIPRNADVNT